MNPAKTRVLFQELRELAQRSAMEPARCVAVNKKAQTLIRASTRDSLALEGLAAFYADAVHRAIAERQLVLPIGRVA